jgi:hypothetical protein
VLTTRARGKVKSLYSTVIEQNYGKKDKKCEKVIKGLYVELDLESTYQVGLYTLK